jgi:hypothetical protein
MADITSTISGPTEFAPNGGLKSVWYSTPATSDSGDTFTITLSSLGILATGFICARGYIQTTTGSVEVAEDPTTSVTAGVLTLTIGGATNNKVRWYMCELRVIARRFHEANQKGTRANSRSCI